MASSAVRGLGGRRPLCARPTHHLRPRTHARLGCMWSGHALRYRPADVVGAPHAPRSRPCHALASRSWRGSRGRPLTALHDGAWRHATCAPRSGVTGSSLQGVDPSQSSLCVGRTDFALSLPRPCRQGYRVGRAGTLLPVREVRPNLSPSAPFEVGRGLRALALGRRRARLHRLGAGGMVNPSSALRLDLLGDWPGGRLLLALSAARSLEASSSRRFYADVPSARSPARIATRCETRSCLVILEIRGRSWPLRAIGRWLDQAAGPPSFTIAAAAHPRRGDLAIAPLLGKRDDLFPNALAPEADFVPGDTNRAAVTRSCDARRAALAIELAAARVRCFAVSSSEKCAPAFHLLTGVRGASARMPRSRRDRLVLDLLRHGNTAD